MSQHPRKPPWIKIQHHRNEDFHEVGKMIQSLHLHTVCEEANCPNRTECYGNKTATFLILGSVCTRQCKFCNVSKGTPDAIDPQEPQHVAQACLHLNLEHAVITSVTRDDLPDGGAEHFAQTIHAVRETHPSCSIEVLTPDFQGSASAIAAVAKAKPEVFNHNIETIPRLYQQVRPGADYKRSLHLLEYVKTLNPSILTKSGLMVGLGESPKEVESTLRDLHLAQCDAVTIGQYLPPGKDYYPLADYIHPQQFEEYRKMALKIGFKHVASSPLTRSSYHAKNMVHHHQKEEA